MADSGRENNPGERLMTMFPVMLNLRDRRCLVVGGGGVALRKVEGLVAEGASVTVVATEPIGALEGLD